MGGDDSENIKEIAASTLTEEQRQHQEKFAKEQEEAQIQMDLEHANKINEMKIELEEEKKISQDSIASQMEEQKKKVCWFSNEFFFMKYD